METAMQQENAPLPTVRDVLSLTEISAGSPELVTGDLGLMRPVRWAHVVAGASAAALLDGGELVLTTGAGWPSDDASLAALAETLTGADPAAVVFELGAGFETAPPALVARCLEHGIPLIALHNEVRFVQITQRVHQRVLAAQNEALEAREAVHSMLTELGLNRSPVDYVVARIADVLGSPVVLEDAGHRVIAWAQAGPQTGTVPAGDDELLAVWAAAQHSGADPRPPAGSTRVAVEARGQRWGFLTALPGAPHPAGRATVLELGAFALALGRLADADGEQWLELGSKRLFDAVLEGRYRGERDLTLQLESAGLPMAGRELFGATLTGTGDFGGHEGLELATLRTALRRAVAPDGRVLLAANPRSARGLVALLSFPEDDPRTGQTRALTSADLLPDAPHPLASRLAKELEMMLPATLPASWRARLSLGVAARRPKALISSLERIAHEVPAGAGALGAGPVGPGPAARSVARTVRGSGRVDVLLAERQPLAYLVRGLSSTPEVQDFSRSMLEPLVTHDGERGAGHSGDLLVVLAAYLAHPTNRSLAAQEARLSRSVFYQRIALIEELLDVDLAEGATIAALTVALLARG
ncbi:MULTISPECIES: PucR family transcriptional regulator [unclassified Leucobacter]|uniref:PucR family transcriptional regulator n=1 Tax=unclassified Leucobacter TaxID=2621730 RepID=UPI00203CD471|nr:MULTISPECIES: PucR family transcriptional regulator [unclassified Leucobacter]